MAASRRRLVIDASQVAVVHTYLAFSAFLTAFVIGSLLHYKKIVKNGVAGYPEEWFPSVSATIGDWYPERNIFQILIALTAGPRFTLVFLHYWFTCSASSWLSILVFISGIVRTFSCGGWVYITSTDDHDAHDILMIIYIVMNVPWMVGGIFCTPATVPRARSTRRYIATAFFISMIPMIYFFVQHKVHEVPGAYTYYSLFEWGLIFLDVLYDSVVEIDFKESNLQIVLGSSLEDSHTNHMHVSDSSDVVNEHKTVTNVDSTAGSVVASALLDTTIGISQSQPESSQNKAGQRKTWTINMIARKRPHVIGFISDVYLSYIFWSIFTSLVPTMFFFSIWELGLAGHELSLVATLSPVFLSIPPFLSWARTHTGRAVLRSLSFSALLAYLLDDPLNRLLLVVFGTAVGVVQQTVEWCLSADNIEYQGILMGLGLILSSLTKHANHSNNPVWPFINAESGGWNRSGIVLALLALLETYTRLPSSSSIKGSLENLRKGTVEINSVQEHWLPSAVAFGALIFNLHCFLTDSSTLIAWSWTGYTNRRPNGPLPHLYGSLTLIAQCIGLLLPLVLYNDTMENMSFLSNPVWFLFGSCSALVLYSYGNWVGYTGGLGLAVFLMSIIIIALRQTAATSHIGKTFFTAFLVAAILDFAGTFTVAYAFVPGGVYLRERTDLILALQMILLLPLFHWRNSDRALRFARPSAEFYRYSMALLALFSVSAVLVTLYRIPVTPPQPLRAGSRIIRAGIWTVHFGIDNGGRDSQRRIRDILRDMELDVVGLLETDLHRIVNGNRDLTRVITEELGYYVDLGPGPNSHTWGAALLSKFPIVNTTHHLLPSPDGELAPAIEAVLDIYGTEVMVVVVHNGQEETPLDRELQSAEVARMMAASYPTPLIFLGYVVSKPKAARPAPYDILVNDGRVHDIDRDDWDRWCEYIFYRGLYRTSYARISRGVVTDTELQVGQFVMPRHDASVANDTDQARYLRCRKEELPEDHWFPMEYYETGDSHGKNGHFYHVFYTPLYYRIPEGAIL